MSYAVQERDTLWELSRKHKIPIQDLLRQLPEAVQRDPRKLQIGMTLQHPNLPNTAQKPALQGRPVPPRTPASYQMMSDGQKYDVYKSPDKSIPTPSYPEELRSQPPTTWERLKREAPGEFMKLLQGLPPTQMAAGAGRLANMFSRGDPLENLGGAIAAPFERPIANMADKYNRYRQTRAEDMRTIQNLDDAFSGGAQMGPETFSPLLPRQLRAQRVNDRQQGLQRLGMREQPLDFDPSKASGISIRGARGVSPSDYW